MSPRLTHVVYTRSNGGKSRLFVDGRKVAEKQVAGNLAPWKQAYQLGIGNEISGERPWLGTFHLIAIYSRGLSEGEVQGHFKAGAKATMKPKAPEDLSGELFEEKIASLLANRCVECHEPGVKEGKLDLTRHSKDWAPDGLLVPGKSADSLLWEMVESDEMPEDRDPLSAEEKKLLRQWIDGGASWTVAEIDPANYRDIKETKEIWVRRLTVPEYIETVKATLGVDIGTEAREMLPRDLRADGFSNTAYNLSVDLSHVDAYARLAQIIVDRLDVKAFTKRFSPKQNVNDKDMRALIEGMGKWVLRGRLDESELDLYRGITTTVVTAGGDFEEAVAFVIEAMLQSPKFLYRIEKQRGDGSAWPVTGHELASRMSYTIWGASPDEPLFRAGGNSGSRMRKA